MVMGIGSLSKNILFCQSERFRRASLPVRCTQTGHCEPRRRMLSSGRGNPKIFPLKVEMHLRKVCFKKMIDQSRK
jgi:hypothetical protein